MNKNIPPEHENGDQQQWSKLISILKSGLELDESQFIDFDPEVIIHAAKQRS